MRFVILIVVCLFTSVANAQTPILDSLKNKLENESNREEQFDLLIKICNRHYSMSPESFLAFIMKAEQIAPPGSPDFYLVKNSYSIYLSKMGKVNEGLTMVDTLLGLIPHRAEFDKARLRLTIAKSNLLIRTNQSESAINNTLQLLRESEEKKDTLLIMSAYTIMGYAYLEIEKYNDAINWLNKGYHFTTDENILKQCGYLFSNNASCYNNIGKMDSAFYFIELALKYGRMDENLSVQTNALNIRAAMYLKEEEYDKAEQDLKEALVFREKAGDLIMLSADMAQFSSFYASINETDKGIAMAQKGIALIQPLNNLSKQLFLYTALAENYQKANRIKEYAQTLEKIASLKDTLNEINSEHAIAEMSAKYELQKKEKIILQQQYHLARNKYYTLGFVFLLISGATISWLFYKNYHQRQNLKMQQAIAEQKRITKEAVVIAEENERKRIAADLHDNLGSYAAAISSNVKYLKDNNNGNDNSITSQLEENAQSIVTQLSDTIWVLKNERLQLTQLADRFKSWMQRWMKNYPHIKYFYSETIENDKEYSPEKILHIFLMLKECVTNAVKHSGCERIKVNFTNTDILKITIEDDGEGIQRINFEGNGIENLKQRAVMSNLTIVWQQATNGGTLVVLSGSTTN